MSSDYNIAPIRGLKDLQALPPGTIGRSLSGKYYKYDPEKKQAVQVNPEELKKEETVNDGQAGENLVKPSEARVIVLAPEAPEADPPVQPEAATPASEELPKEDLPPVLVEETKEAEPDAEVVEAPIEEKPEEPVVVEPVVEEVEKTIEEELAELLDDEEVKKEEPAPVEVLPTKDDQIKVALGLIDQAMQILKNL